MVSFRRTVSESQIVQRHQKNERDAHTLTFRTLQLSQAFLNLGFVSVCALAGACTGGACDCVAN